MKFLSPMGNRLPRHCRIVKKTDFKQAFSKGITRKTQHLKAVIYPTGGEWSRIGLAVSRKVGNAVQRNRLKRRLREIFRLQRDLAPEVRDIIFIPRPGCASLAYETIADEAQSLIAIEIAQRSR
jgi:ribonuclease P protein component